MAIPIPLASAARRLAPPADAGDAELLARFTRSRDPEAFEAIVRRHGPAVRGVCRARLGNPADADDAFQATFLVLARDAHRVRESLAGWLYRVAQLVSLKLRRHNARRVTDALPADPTARGLGPDESIEVAELRAAVAEEVAALPDKFRGVLVLCGLEGRSNAEAAAILGCPKGTVDTRLAAAKRKLRDRLVRRGVALGVAAGSDGLLGRADAGSGFESLAAATVADALSYTSTGGVGSNPTVALLANGVKPTMTHTTRLLAAGLLAAAALGTAGLGLYHADAQEKKEKAEPPKKVVVETKEGPAVVDRPAEAQVAVDEKAVRAKLATPARELPEAMTLRDFFEWLYERHGLVARLDIAAFKRLGADAAVGAAGDPLGRGVFVALNPAAEPVEVLQLYEMKVRFPAPRGLTVADALSEAVVQLPGRCAYRVRGNHILIGPAFVLPTVPGSGASRPGEEIEKFVDHRQLAEYIAGPPISVAIEDKPLSQAVQELRKLTGANIVIDARAKGNASQSVSATFDDVRLLTVLQILGDMAELKPVVLNNVYYLTSPENAAKLQKEVNRDLYGEPQANQQVPVPPGFVTDGYQYYPRTSDMKAVDPATVLGGGLGFSGGGLGGAAPGVKPVPAPMPPAAQPKPPEKK